MERLFTTRKTIRYIFFSIVVIIFIDSCKKDSSVINTPPPPKITIASVKPLSGKPGDTILIIGVHFNLNPSLDTVKFNGIAAQVQKVNTDSLFVTVPKASSTGVITVNGISAPPPDFTVLLSDSADIYIGGSGVSPSNHQTAQYWKNGIPVILSDGTKNETTCGIVVSGSDIYLAGNQSTDSSAFPEYWKNGTSVVINEPNGQALSLAVSGSDVYVAGAINSRPPLSTASIAAYWKNGISVKLTDGSQGAYATGIAVSGNDVYVCGVEVNTQNMINVNVAKIWKNGIVTNLSDGTTIAYASSIMVVGNDVYIAGFVQDPITGIYVAKYWKNGIPVVLTTSGNGIASCIFVSGNDVYVAGSINSYAVYWKNGHTIELNRGSAVTSGASSIFVTNF
jgi:hypothetical protein